MMRARTLPQFDPKTGANPFTWIFETAQAVRAERQAEQHARLVIDQLNRRADLSPAKQR